MDLAVELMREKGWDAALEAALGASLKRDGVNPEAAEIWIRLCVQWNQWERAEQSVNALRDRETLWVPACDAYVRKLGEADHVDALQAFVAANTDALQRHAYTWAATGAGLHMAGLHEEALRWFSTWRQRGDVEPWMMLPAVDSLWCSRREDEGDNLAEQVLELPADYSQPSHAVWRAIYAAVRGETDSAMRWLALAPPDLMETAMEYYLALGRLACFLVELQREPSVVWRSAKSRLREAMIPFADIVEKEPLLRRLYFRALWRLAVDCNKPLTATWWKLRERWFSGKTGLQ